MLLDRTVIAGIGLTALLAAQPTLADHRYRDPYGSGTDYDYARVIDVDPIVRYVTVEVPRRECWEEVVYRDVRPRGTAGATIAGGIIGGVVGHQFGSGRGNDLATVAGTLIGSAIARDVAEERRGYRRETDTVQRCRVHREVHREQRIEGYHVTYVYLGRQYTTRMDYDPGQEVQVRVAVTPLEG